MIKIILLLNLDFVLPFIIILFMLLFGITTITGQQLGASIILFIIGIVIYIVIGFRD